MTCYTYKKICGQWCHHKACEGLLLQVANIAEPCQVVRVHQSHDEDDNGFDSWDGPCCYVEVGAVHFDGLMAPLQPSRQEPGEGQDHPPEKGGRSITNVYNPLLQLAHSDHIFEWSPWAFQSIAFEKGKSEDKQENEGKG